MAEMRLDDEAVVASHEQPDYEPTQEVRFALVMYGGSSLCIYMNGVAQEFLHLVRATAPASQGSAKVAALGADAGTEAVYRKLGQLLSYGDVPHPGPAAQSDAVTTRFVVDIISGSSAGGINGVFLAKALANDQSLDQLKALWIEEGDFDLLLNDSRRVKDTPGLRNAKPPASLLSGTRMYRKLIDAFTDMDDKISPTTPSRLVEELDLAVTTTDLRGVPLPIKLFDSVISERRYRNVFQLKYRTEDASGREHNDFLRISNPGLAFVARCTSSFPFVFEPTVLDDVNKVLETLPKPYPPIEGGTGVPSDWGEIFFPDYQRVNDPYRYRSFSDGGDIDNKPFSYAIDNLAIRRANVPVNRKLVYVEPDPGTTSGLAAVTTRIDPVTSVLKAVSLPRAETIREDLDRVRAHNLLAKRVHEVTQTVEGALALRAPRFGPRGVGLRGGSEAAAKAPAGPHTEAETSRWLNERGDVARQRGLSYIVYHRLKVQQAVERLGLLIALAAGIDGESDHTEAIRILVQEWVGLHYADPFGDKLVPALTENHFLLAFDLDFRMRRINFVERRADELLCDNERSAELLALATESDAAPLHLPTFKKIIKHAKAELNTVYVNLRKLSRELTSVADRLVPALGIDTAQLDGILVGPASTGLTPADRAATLLADPRLRSSLMTLADELCEKSAKGFKAAADAVDKALSRDTTGVAEEGTARRALRFFFDQFDDYDMAILPLLLTEGSEAASVDVLRISPYDATSLISAEKASTKLAGNQLGHFGAFGHARWRRNDIMWGRLDAAERLITALLPVGHDQREVLLVEAQKAILAEEMGGPDVARELSELIFTRDVSSMPETTRTEMLTAVNNAIDPASLRKQIHAGFTLPAGPDPEYVLKVASRATRIVGEMLKELSRAKPASSPGQALTPAPGRYPVSLPGRLLARFGQFGWGLVEISVPHTMGWRVGRYWLQLLIFVEAFLIATGILLTQRGAVRLGWLTLAITVVVGLAKTLVGGVIGRARHPILRVVVAAAATLAAIAVLLGVLFLGVRGIENARDRVCRSDSRSFVRKVAPFSCPPTMVTISAKVNR